MSGNGNQLVGFAKIRHDIYCTKYRNILARVCGTNKEFRETDFFVESFENTQAIVDHYRNNPTAITCMNRSWGSGFDMEATYLVVGSADRVVLLLPPEVALERNLPYLAVLEGSYFKPHLGCAITYWDRFIEPNMFPSIPALSAFMSNNNFATF